MSDGDLIAYLVLNGIFSVIIAVIGSNRRIGGFGAFLVSFLFSIVVGLIVVLLSKSNEDIEREEEMLKTQKDTLAATKQKSSGNLIEDLTKLKALRDDGILTDDEFLSAKKRILNSDSSKTPKNEVKKTIPQEHLASLGEYMYTVKSDNDFGDDKVKIIETKNGTSTVINQSGKMTKYVKHSDLTLVI